MKRQRSTLSQRSTLILQTVHMHKNAGVKEIARKLNTSRSRAWILIEDMEKAGLIRMSRDNRVGTLRLTEKGTTALTAANA